MESTKNIQRLGHTFLDKDGMAKQVWEHVILGMLKKNGAVLRSRNGSPVAPAFVGYSVAVYLDEKQTNERDLQQLADMLRGSNLRAQPMDSEVPQIMVGLDVPVELALERMPHMREEIEKSLKVEKVAIVDASSSTKPVSREEFLRRVHLEELAEKNDRSPHPAKPEPATAMSLARKRASGAEPATVARQGISELLPDEEEVPVPELPPAFTKQDVIDRLRMIKRNHSDLEFEYLEIPGHTPGFLYTIFVRGDGSSLEEVRDTMLRYNLSFQSFKSTGSRSGLSSIIKFKEPKQ